MPFVEITTQHGASVGRAAQMAVAREPRFGCIAARIHSSHKHRLGIAALGRPAGALVYLEVKDGTRFPDEGEQATWRCYNPECRGKKWETKRELLADHPEQRLLAQQREVHVYCAVVEIAAVPAVAEVVKDGKVTSPARPEQPAVLMLLSDEE